MTGRVQGKVALITGAARGQGRSHAIQLAREGADIIAIDNLDNYETVSYEMASSDDFAQTVDEVNALDRLIVAVKADVRDRLALTTAIDDAVAQLGKLDIVCANAGICTVQPWDKVTPQMWQDTLDVNLTGVWNTIVAAIPHLKANGGGSVIAISSVAGLKGHPFFAPYTASKHGVVGMARSLANELAKEYIRVNTVHPTGVDTRMADGLKVRLGPLLDNEPGFRHFFTNGYPVERVDPVDVSNAVLYLASDESRYVTGLALTVDAGIMIA